MTTGYTQSMAWQRMMDLAVQIHQLRPTFIERGQPGLHEDLRSSSIRALTSIARLVGGTGQELRTAPDDVRAYLREVETLGLLASQLGVLDEAQLDRLGGIFSDVRFLLKSHAGA